MPKTKGRLSRTVIPDQYRKYWTSFKTDNTLFHVTTLKNWINIQKDGFIEPRDPSPQYWAGMKAVFFSDPDDRLHPSPLPKLLAYIKKSGENLVRLHIKTNNKLYKSNASGRTFHVMTLQPIYLKDILQADYLRNILKKAIPKSRF